MADAVETTDSTSATPTNDAAAAPAVDAAADPLAAPTLLDDAPATDAKPEGGDPKAVEGEENPEAKELAGAPEAYELKAPEGMALDAEAVKLAEPVFRELNLTNEQAQKLTDLYPSLIERVQNAGQAQMADQVAAVRADWAKASQADAEIGGAKLDESKSLAAKAMDGLKVPEAFRTFLNESGLGNHPEMIRLLRRVGTAISEDGFSRGTGSQASRQSKEERWYGKAASGE